MIVSVFPSLWTAPFMPILSYINSWNHKQFMFKRTPISLLTWTKNLWCWFFCRISNLRWLNASYSLRYVHSASYIFVLFYCFCFISKTKISLTDFAFHQLRFHWNCSLCIGCLYQCRSSSTLLFIWPIWILTLRSVFIMNTAKKTNKTKIFS